MGVYAAFGKSVEEELESSLEYYDRLLNRFFMLQIGSLLVQFITTLLDANAACATISTTGLAVEEKHSGGRIFS